MNTKTTAHSRLTTLGVEIAGVGTDITVDCSGLEIRKNVDVICDLEHVVWLSLRNSDITNDDLVFLHKLQHLRFLSISNTKIDGTGLVNLQDLPQLNVLHLDRMLHASSGIKYVARIKTLEAVDACDTDLSDVEFQSLITTLPLLSRLDLSNTNVTQRAVSLADHDDAYPYKTLMVYFGDGTSKLICRPAQNGT